MTVTLHCTNVNNRSRSDHHNTPFWVCQQNGQVQQSTFLCLSTEFAQHLSCSSRHDPSASWQPPWGRLFVRCLETCTKNSQSLFVNAAAGINIQTRWLKPIDMSFGFGAALYLTVELPLVSCARGRPQFSDCCDGTAARCWRSVSVGIHCRAYCSIPGEIRTQDFSYPGCCHGSCTPNTNVPADLNTSIPFAGPILTSSVRTACYLVLENFLVLLLLCMKE